MARRFACGALLCCLLPAAFAFTFEDVAARAKKLAASPYAPPEKNLPRSLANLDYDQLRDIRFDPAKALWRNNRLPFEIAFFHQGRSFDTPVRINEIVGKTAHEIRFDPKLFNYGANNLPAKDLAELGYAGFRVHYPINTLAYKDEVLTFQGASYFRALGKGQLYGLSARGLAVDTALSSGEEFPQFTEFWVERPGPTEKQLTIYALLDSRRVAGAYRFVLRPGIDTVIDVKAQLYLRENVTKLGIAPLTSMYFFGENQRSQVEDYRPEVHDSDGLSIHSGTGEWIWRPLVNPKRLLVTSYALTNPAGFGLMQRDRRFADYEDLEARYEMRPSVWIEPKGQWGAGRVELVQIPTPDETNDNIVAYWVPDAPPKPGAPLDIEYRLLWQKEVERRPPSSWTTQTRRGHGWVRKPDDTIALMVDFEGPALKKLPVDATLLPVVSADPNGKILETNVIRNEVNGGWRMTVKLKRVDEKKPVELRGYLSTDNTTLSETWSYILSPE
ncbi:glucans biosynthesis protein [Noviherbaspirillum humi]|uniref:Glucans biosynthesis protein G n=2 Tax=Noviherbaspirillum humi TaxID=1688639 RepID=A0A239KIV8_9BURK|nr:glucan biosynthesis protein G [Noviherbaspirillum humi]SNT18101.1 glucans biosynthesis protein [Noviherbaspirillum humi]